MLSGSIIQDMKLRVTFYARVSTDKDEQMHSLTSQISYFKDYIMKNSNWLFVEGYIDEGISGTSINKREKFLQMIDDAKNSKFDLILTKEISRFSRNTIDSIRYTQELLQYGVGVYFLNDNINTILPDSELRLTIMASVAQDEVRKLSERVHFGMKRSIENGVVLGCSNIYGYIKNNGKLVIEESQADMIRFIYDNYANTPISLSSLAKLLLNKGYLNNKGNPIDIMVIQRIIQNPKYKGYYCGNKTKIVDYRTKLKEKLHKSEWKIYKDFENVPPIVNEEIWQKANQKLIEMKNSFKNRQLNTKIFQNRYTYSGKIFCKKHQSSYHRSSSGERKKNPTWECREYRKNGIKGCSNPKLFERQLDSFFSNLIEERVLIKEDILENVLEEYKEYLQINNVDYTILILEKKQKNYINKKEKLIDLYIEKRISKTDFESIKSDYEEKIVKLNNEIDKLKIEKTNEKTIYEKLDFLKKELVKIEKNVSCFNELFNIIVDKIIVESYDLKYKNKAKLKILLKSGNILFAISDNRGHNFHLTDYYTTNNSSKCCN